MRINRGSSRTTEGFLRRRSSLPMWVDLSWRVGLVFALIAVVLLLHWVGRDGLKDNLDNHISFVDVLYFTTVTVTTVGYGDIVPVTPEARLFESLFVTPIRLFVWLIFLGTAYSLFLRNILYRWRMARIQADLHNHIIVTGFGTSGQEAVHELLARGTDPREIVVIDGSEAALELAEAQGCNILCGDSTRDRTLKDVAIHRARSMIVSAGRDDTSILITLTARHLAPRLPISIVVRNEDNELPARQAGATTVINPVSFAGLLLAGSTSGKHIADYMADLAASGGRVKLNERFVSPQEIGGPLSAITTGLGVRIYRDDRPIGFWEPGAQQLQTGDLIIEIVESDGLGTGGEPA
ncbi:potassium transporter TrkA [Sphingobium sp. GW456-12-10-14-TSB1]|uniref:Potassium transporter TrkA n=2 Tax=Sphingomonadaceae TaxID=41297 RepID=A0A249MPD0_SPHXE|nr:MULTISPECIES: potassium channel protein [Sphingobium]ASY43044.1 potassium transporter TrkA [Sphingobium xenophagum]OUC55049.1 potassium transporter TrkA [Sphingobium sp. GW456-12-10-14-TSB1]QWT13805.1 NAD-binding protein [Sphingobium xenophagum]